MLGNLTLVKARLPRRVFGTMCRLMMLVCVLVTLILVSARRRWYHVNLGRNNPTRRRLVTLMLITLVVCAWLLMGRWRCVRLVVTSKVRLLNRRLRVVKAVGNGCGMVRFLSLGNG